MALAPALALTRTNSNWPPYELAARLVSRAKGETRSLKPTRLDLDAIRRAASDSPTRQSGAASKPQRYYHHHLSRLSSNCRTLFWRAKINNKLDGAADLPVVCWSLSLLVCLLAPLAAETAPEVLFATYLLSIKSASRLEICANESSCTIFSC